MDKRTLKNWRDKQRRDSLKKQCIEYLGGVCSECFKTHHPSAFDFHHREDESKDFTISHAISKQRLTFEELLPELDKCDLMCSNCHRELHSKEVADRYNFNEEVI